MKNYIHEKFLLTNNYAEKLYNEFARNMPIYDYHSHLPVKEIADNRRFHSITEIWLEHDHYKWRAMRWCGVQEHLITGDASDFEKFKAWAGCIPFLLRNPLYQWCHMELAVFFDSGNVLLGPETAEKIYEKCNSILNNGDFSTRNILNKMNVDTLYTTNDPVEDLKYHRMLKEDKSFNINVYPTFRPDNALCVENPDRFKRWIAELEKTTNIAIDTIDDLMEAFEKCYENFHEAGCRASDHGIEITWAPAPALHEVRKHFKKIRSGNKLTMEEVFQYRAFLMKVFAELNNLKGWVMQLHIGANRNNSTLYFDRLGPWTRYRV